MSERVSKYFRDFCDDCTDIMRRLYIHNEELISDLERRSKFYRFPRFWVWYQFLYPFIYSMLFFIFIGIAFGSWNIAEGHIVLGSIISLLSGLSVIISYLMIIPWRKHPSNIILYRALTSVVFSVNIILNAIASNTSGCLYFSFISQWMLLASEFWITMLAADLVASVTNPFTSYKTNMQRYHIIVWGCSLIISIVFYNNLACHGTFDGSLCWIEIKYGETGCLWGYYLFWIVVGYVYQLWGVGFTVLRLRKGLPATFEVRKKTANLTFTIIICYFVYLSTIMLFYFIIIVGTANDPTSASLADFSFFTLFCIANKGTIDGIVWFYTHSFELKSTIKSKQGEVSKSSSQLPSIDSEKDQVNPLTSESASPENFNSEFQSSNNTDHKINLKENFDKLGKTFKNSITEIADLAIEDIDEGDLSPQVNLALRQQIVQYVTTGVKVSVQKFSASKELIVPSTKRDPTEKNNPLNIIDQMKDPAMVDSLPPPTTFLLENELPFKSFAPDLFRELRLNEGIDDEYYLHLLSSPANERLSEGASGAFMFFCGNGELIVKTIRAREAKVLHQSLQQYTDYLRENKESLLCRFLGSYSLAVYSQTFYFVIMRNCFDPCADINERFDVKGSWVGRSADPTSTKKRATCRHCNTYFVPSKKEQCTAIVGRHEANVVLKDNDMRTKISLNPQRAEKMIYILLKDSDLLGQLGVIDYSLLVGVKKWKFPVNVPDDEIEKSSKPRSSHALAHPDSIQPTFKAYSVTGPAVYYFGIVDFLQDWTFNKQVERTAKIYLMRKDPDGLSVMEPIAYKKRFQAKMRQLFDRDDKLGLVVTTSETYFADKRRGIKNSHMSSIDERDEEGEVEPEATGEDSPFFGKPSFATIEEHKGKFMMLLKAQDELNRDSGREDRVDRQTGTNSDGNARRDIEEGQEGSENSAGPHQATISTTYTNPGTVRPSVSGVEAKTSPANSINNTPS